METQTLKVNNVSRFKKMIPFNHKLAPLFIRNALYALIPEGTEHIYVAGIGSNMISGDSIGPFVGTLLSDLYPEHLTVLGTLQNPLDALTLTPVLSQITLPNNSYLIGVDSVLGSENILNSIVIKEGAILPGLGLGNRLPPVGDCSIMGVVLEKDQNDEFSLLYTNLDFVYTISVNIAKGISLTVRQYFKYPSDHPILSTS